MRRRQWRNGGCVAEMDCGFSVEWGGRTMSRKWRLRHMLHLAAAGDNEKKSCGSKLWLLQRRPIACNDDRLTPILTTPNGNLPSTMGRTSSEDRQQG